MSDDERERLLNALVRQYKGFKERYGCYPEELRRPWNVKLWFNTRFPWWRLCWTPWCLRFEAKDSFYCDKHKDD